MRLVIGVWLVVLDELYFLVLIIEVIELLIGLGMICVVNEYVVFE